MVPVLGCLLIAMLWANACQPAPNRAVGTQDERKTPNAGRTLVIIAGGELATFAGKAVLLSGTAVDTRSNNARYVLNATLSDLDGQGLPNPFLAEALPDLNTGTWLGSLTLSGGTGRFSGFHASINVDCTPHGSPCTWDGTYNFTPPGHDQSSF